jgi:hypothetical protein
MEHTLCKGVYCLCGVCSKLPWDDEEDGLLPGIEVEIVIEGVQIDKIQWCFQSINADMSTSRLNEPSNAW